MFDFLKTKPQIVTRFAPSPTGELHIGGARTALFAFLFARHHGGKFLLRIEDTDRERYVPESVGHIMEALDWLGLTPDNKDHIVIQSKRLEIYKKYAFELLEKSRAYICVCSREKLAADREKQMAEKKPPRYEGHCRELNISPAAAEKGTYVIRMKMPEKGTVTVKDLIRGDVVFDLSLFDDQVLLKSDGYPTYHLASVVDDHEMKISHVIRAEEWLPSTPKHLLLYGMFGWKAPEFAHLPMILAPDRSKLSKRHGATGVFEYQKMGYLPDAILNFIALLGWHLPYRSRPEAGIPTSLLKNRDNASGEIFSLPELIKEFSLDRVQKSGAVFDIKKLDWLNGEYMKNLSAEDIYGKLKEFYRNEPEIISDKDGSLKLLELGKSRMQKLSDFPALKDSFAISGYERDLLKWKDKSAEEMKANLLKIREMLRSALLSGFSRKNLETHIMPYADSAGRGAVLWPLRVALSGKDKSPGPFEIMEVIGKDETLRRIEIAIKKLTNGN